MSNVKLFFHLSLAVLVVLVACSEALKCWRCENARSPGQCIEFGRMQVCKKTETVCQTELRFSSGWGSRPTIRTSCKEEHACGNNHIQNPRSAWRPSQCNGGIANSVCRCCCNTDNCNENELLCETMFANATKKPPSEPTCVTPPKAPEHGNVSCQRSRYIGSVCKYVCNPGYLLVGNDRALCQGFGDIAMWTGALPVCRRLPVCTPVIAPKNGDVKCFGNDKVGAYCIFSCDPRFELDGAAAVSCVNTPAGPAWTDEPPTCPPARCSDLGGIKYGNVNCTTTNNTIGTICKFDCGESELFLTPVETENSQCVWRQGRAQWTHRKPCCSGVVCPPTARKDIVIAIDSSGSISSDEWVQMKRFVMRVVGKFHISPNNVRIAMFRFNKEIDTSSQILFGDHENIKTLTTAIQNMPKNGGGTYIGQALRYARDYVFKHNNRPNVSDMLWILTDGKSNDEFKATAKQLRESGVDIIALGISRKGHRSFMQQLLDITGDKDLIMEVSDVINSFEDDLIQLATSKICEIHCAE